MKRNIITIIALLCLTAPLAWSQQTPVTEANYDLAERFSPNKINSMVFSKNIRPSWFPNSDKFWYEWKSPEGVQYWIVGIPSTPSTFPSRISSSRTKGPSPSRFPRR